MINNHFADLQNLTKSVTHFKHELNIGSDEDKSNETHEKKNPPKSLQEKSEEKDANSRPIDNKLASNLSKIPQLVTGNK